MKKFLVNKLPFLGKYKRRFVAWKNHLASVKDSYSQHGEDRIIWKMLNSYNLEGSMYVDVGANHPSDISNTYLLYRKGLRGIVIEPNEELCRLFSRYRPYDICLKIGCSDSSAVLPFHISKTPVISSFKLKSETNAMQSVYVPVMKLDDALSAFETDFYSLVSIDVEGLNYEVLQGALQTLKSTLMLCIEFDSDEEQMKIRNIIPADFEEVQQIGCNILYLHTGLSSKKIIR
ncbi:MAG: FkbM family methyltransferase [Ferruginibacter sp.]|nr:FkbM family methyltransferase [Ferruginibacter sp.]